MTDRVAHDPGAPALEVEGLSAGFGPEPAVHGISFRMDRGERVAVVGPNGAGKTTLFHAISGLLAPQAGSVRIGGSPPGRHRCIAYVPQRSAVDWHFPMTVGEAVRMGCAGTFGWERESRSETRAWVTECLSAVGLAAYERRPIAELSGGQQQRLFIARARAQRAELMLLDEPAGGLDAPSQEDLGRMVHDLAARGVAVLMATHDFDAAARAGRVILLNGTVLADGPPSSVLTEERLDAAFRGASSWRGVGRACGPHGADGGEEAR
ncbi:MAG: metal ABC transporter ATP-binding protein [Kiritimatiellae bacterium]|nr:metal ABC transporter ATP-binding protein [Kiritimatiellia bacterium]